MNTNMVFLDGGLETYQPVEYYKASFNNAAEYEEKYLPSIWKGLTDEQKKGEHHARDRDERRHILSPRAGKHLRRHRDQHTDPCNF
jgi:hypothetical protein